MRYICRVSQHTNGAMGAGTRDPMVAPLAIAKITDCIEL